MTNPLVLTVGGTVQAEGGIYVERPADDRLFELCLQHKFAFVLTSRQLGKSSLMVATAQRLEKEGVRCAIVDLNRIGSTPDPERWYVGLLKEIGSGLSLDIDVVRWWREHTALGFTHRFTLFFRDIVLNKIPGDIVVFVDEIDATLRLDFTDDFFAAIRSFYTDRATEPRFKRLAFVLLGVATPSDLIKNSGRTPFNIGTRVDLTDFAIDEAVSRLSPALPLSPERGRQVLEWIFEWTHGHPYLTLVLSNAVRQEGARDWTRRDIADLVSQTFFGDKGRSERNLQFVSGMLTRYSPDLEGVLYAYREICRGRTVRDDEHSIIKAHLKLSGIVRAENGALVVRNKIYRTVFDDAWVRDNLPRETLRQQRIRVLRRWLLIALAALLILSAGLAYVLYLKHKADSATKAAIQAGQRADRLAREKEAEAARSAQLANDKSALAQAAELARGEAESQRQRALQEEKAAKTAAAEANQSAADAAAQRQLAEASAADAASQRDEADKQTKIAQSEAQKAGLAAAEAKKALADLTASEQQRSQLSGRAYALRLADRANSSPAAQEDVTLAGWLALYSFWATYSLDGTVSTQSLAALARVSALLPRTAIVPNPGYHRLTTRFPSGAADCLPVPPSNGSIGGRSRTGQSLSRCGFLLTVLRPMRFRQPPLLTQVGCGPLSAIKTERWLCFPKQAWVPCRG